MLLFYTCYFETKEYSIKTTQMDGDILWLINNLIIDSDRNQ